MVTISAYFCITNSYLVLQIGNQKICHSANRRHAQYYLIQTSLMKP